MSTIQIGDVVAFHYRAPLIDGVQIRTSTVQAVHDDHLIVGKDSDREWSRVELDDLIGSIPEDEWTPEELREAARVRMSQANLLAVDARRLFEKADDMEQVAAINRLDPFRGL